MVLSNEFDAIELEVLNSKLISMVEEAAVSLLKTAYSSVVRDSRDFTCSLMDTKGQLLAQAPFSLPAFTATMPRTVRSCLEEYPLQVLNEGDVLITNDPWLAIGHLYDVCIITPIWRRGKIVAIAANAVHVADIGGRVMSAQAASLYEEGLKIPILKLFDKGNPKADLFKIIKNNVRMSEQTVGDIHAQVAANQVCTKRVVEFMDERGIDDLTPLAGTIQGRSEQAMRKAISEIPDGVYSHEAYTQGFDEEVKIRVTITVSGDEILADYTGSSPQVNRGINCVLNYTFAYTAYTIKCVVAPHIPNNEGCFKPIRVTAPERTIVNPLPPAPVTARSQTGKFLPIPVMRALAQAVPDKVISDSGASPLWAPTFSIRDETTGKEVTHLVMLTGGSGARPVKDGISAIDFPSVIVNVPAEQHEHRFPFLVERWNLITDSGGPGKFRGGLGFDFVVKNISKNPAMASLRCERTEHPALGIQGGKPGSFGSVARGDGTKLHPKKSYVVKQGESIVFSTPGAGGFFSPLERSEEMVLADVKEGLVSLAKAKEDYGIVIDQEPMRVNKEKTAELRLKLSEIRE